MPFRELELKQLHLEKKKGVAKREPLSVPRVGRAERRFWSDDFLKEKGILSF